MSLYQAPREWVEWSEWLAAGLQGRSRWRLGVLLLGVMYAEGRRVVASWLRAAGLSDDYRAFYVFLQSLGKRWQQVGQRVLELVLRRVLAGEKRVLVAIDDTVTKRYGPHVQGAGTHHDPTPGPAGGPFCYGHVWVMLAVLVRHKRWGTIGLPIWSWLYVRRQDVPRLPQCLKWTFQTKLQQGAELVERAAQTLMAAGKQVWAVVDGAYAKRPFVRPLLAKGITLVGRLRKDAALRDLPVVSKKPRRGRKRKYGPHRLSLVKRAAHKRGWQDVTCTLYGRELVKRAKTFLATHHTFGGVIRVVIVQDEQHGPQFFYCTSPAAGVWEILECFADRFTIEQVFHDLKEVWGSGQQQVRHLLANIGVWHLNLWLHTLVELWAWHKSARQLSHRQDSPWDTAFRRPSHADRRKALQSQCLLQQFSAAMHHHPLPRKIRTLLQRLLRLTL